MYKKKRTAYFKVQEHVPNFMSMNPMMEYKEVLFLTSWPRSPNVFSGSEGMPGIPFDEL